MDFATAVSHVIPGTFVPDIGTDDKPNIGAIPAAPGTDATPSFMDMVKQQLSDVNDKMITSETNMKDLATGKTNDLQKVVTSTEEANLALNFTMAMRSKLLEAYQSISQMQV